MTTTSAAATEANTLARFKADTADHEMTILHDDGLYRHVRFAKPGTGFYYYDLVTWPGHLTITGDVGTWTFKRLEDIFEFFRGRHRTYINAGYWAEKLQSGNQNGRDPAKEYDEKLYRQLVKEYTEDFAADLDSVSRAAFLRDVEENLLDTAGMDYPYHSADDAYEVATNYRYKRVPVHPDEDAVDFSFHDVWEWDLRGYSVFFLWACYAIQEGIHQYDAAKVPA